MILASTTVPHLFRSPILVRDYNDFRARTTLCNEVKPFENVLTINSLYNRIYGSPNPLNSARAFAKELLIKGPSLDPQTLIDFVDRFHTLPIAIVDRIIKETDASIQKASSATRQKPVVGGAASEQMQDDISFVNDLIGAMLDCGGSCNYFNPISDQLAVVSNVPEDMSGNVAPIWDVDSDLMQPPIRTSMTSFNKTSVPAQQNMVGLSNLTESIFRRGMNTVSSARRKGTEGGLIEGGKDLSSIAHRENNSADNFSYFKHGEAASDSLAKTRERFSDCFRMHEYHKRYNPLDEEQNLGEAVDMKIHIDNEGAPVIVDGFYEKRKPETKSEKHTISNYHSTKENFVPDTDDTIYINGQLNNYNINPTNPGSITLPS